MLRLRTNGWLATGALAALAATLTAPAPAQACGGFFCDTSQPVNQSAERIIFSHAPDGTVSAIIQIQYSGPAERFAWMLPVAGSPEVSVSSNAAFARLQAATNPQYTLNTTVEGTCREDSTRFGGPSPSAGGGSDAAVAADAGAPPVTVVNQGSVGPYDFVVISVEPSLPEPADVAVMWLGDNGYDVDDFGAERLSPYLEGGMNLLAFRLTKGNDAGSIRPVEITFGPGMASIPIRPTAVAAVADMGVMVWVLGEHRAVPANYMSLELNEALINWLSPGSNYDDVVTEAANQAGGQGFVTEMAGDANPLAESIYMEWERDGWATMEATTWDGQEGTLLFDALSRFGSLDGVRDVVRETVPVPAGATVDDLLSCVSCYYGPDLTDIDGFVPADFLASMRTNVIEPMERARQLFLDHAYVTRLYTTMSADEMTRDPAFDFNPDLGDYSNVHTADRVIECSPSISRFEAPWRVSLPDGGTVRGSGNTWPFAADGPMPANARIVRFGTSGEGEVIEDNTSSIATALTEHNTTVPTPADAGGCSIAAGSTGSSAPLMLLALGGLALWRRRRAA